MGVGCAAASEANIAAVQNKQPVQCYFSAFNPMCLHFSRIIALSVPAEVPESFYVVMLNLTRGGAPDGLLFCKL